MRGYRTTPMQILSSILLLHFLAVWQIVRDKTDPRRCARLGLLVIMLVYMSGCGPSRADAPAPAEERQIRKPYPTFTPTTAANEPIVQAQKDTTAAQQSVDQPAATPTQPPPPPSQPTETPTVAAPTPTPTVATPRLIVNTADVNVRAGPGTNYPILTTVGRGKEMDIVGKDQTNNWWRACCVDEQPIWINKEFVDVDGAVDSVAVSAEVAQVPPTNTPPPAPPDQPAAPTATPPPTQPPAPTFLFDLVVQEQFPEPQIVRIFLYVFEGSKAIEGYSLRVTKDGAPQTVSVSSFGGQPALTWPIADARQRFHNMKVEFPGVAPAGAWEVQLIDSGGAPVGPPTLFQLKGNEPNQELYVRYKKK